MDIAFCILLVIFGAYASYTWRDRKWLWSEIESLRRAIGRLENENDHWREEAGTQLNNYENACSIVREVNKQVDSYRKKYMSMCVTWSGPPNSETPHKKLDVNDKRFRFGKRRRIKLHE